MFNPQKLGNIGSHIKSGVSFQLFSYVGDEDSKATISASGYFNSIKESLRKNDMISVLDLTVSPASMYTLRIYAVPLNSSVLTTEIGVSPYAEHIESVTANYTIKDTDYFIHVESGGVVVTLPSATKGKQYVIKNASKGVVIVTAQDRIDGETIQTLASKESLSVYSNGVEWWYY
jgi:hypothetical protein